MAGGRDWDVFLAYASPDRARAWVLYDALTAADLRVCFDQVVLRPDDNWHRELPRHLRSSAIVLALVSSHTPNAHFETDELLIAINQVRREGARLVPVLLHAGAELPYGTHALHAAEFFSDADAAPLATAMADVARNPSRAPVVRGSQVWSSRVPAVPRVFAGRDALLAQWEATTSGAVLTQTIHGMGGVGKTTVAAALAEAQRHRLDVVWWVRSEQPEVLVTDLAELAPEVGVTVEDDPAATAAAVRNWLETSSDSWLVVFDNAPDEASLERWRPRRGRGATIVTSRNRNMGRLGDVLSVDTFPPAVAEMFLRDRVRPQNPTAAAEDLTEVLTRLNGLPLALEQAAAWVERVPTDASPAMSICSTMLRRSPFPTAPVPSTTSTPPQPPGGCRLMPPPLRLPAHPGC